MKYQVHGNGILRIRLQDDLYLHIYDPRIPRQKVRTDIHDHRFGFISKVLQGELTQIKYRTTLGPQGGVKYRLAEVNGQVENGLRLTLTLEELIVIQNKTYKAGEEYSLHPQEIHQVFSPGFTITLLKKTEYSGIEPRIFIPEGQVPDNDFDNSEKELW